MLGLWGPQSLMSNQKVSPIDADFANIFFRPIAGYLSNPETSEVMVNGHNDIWIEDDKGLWKAPESFSPDALLAAVNSLAQYVGRPIIENIFSIDARMPDGSRVCIVLPPVSGKDPIFAIRKFKEVVSDLDFLVKKKTLTAEMVEFIDALVKVKKNMMVSGGTSSGKTTLLNLIAAKIPDHDRIITIEDSRELQLKQDHVLPLEARPADKHGKGEFSIRQCLKSSLRLRPDRIIVGEIRAGEAFDLIQAMNTGHGGCMGTVHANAPTDTLRRIESLALTADVDMPLVALRSMIASALDIIICPARLSDGSRKIVQIAEIGPLTEKGDYQTYDIIRYVSTHRDKDTGKLVGYFEFTGHVPSFFDMFEAEGVLNVPIEFFRKRVIGDVPDELIPGLRERGYEIPGDKAKIPSKGNDSNKKINSFADNLSKPFATVDLLNSPFSETNIADSANSHFEEQSVTQAAITQSVIKESIANQDLNALGDTANANDKFGHSQYSPPQNALIQQKNILPQSAIQSNIQTQSQTQSQSYHQSTPPIIEPNLHQAAIHNSPQDIVQNALNQNAISQIDQYKNQIQENNQEDAFADFYTQAQNTTQSAVAINPKDQFDANQFNSSANPFDTHDELTKDQFDANQSNSSVNPFDTHDELTEDRYLQETLNKQASINYQDDYVQPSSNMQFEDDFSNNDMSRQLSGESLANADTSNLFKESSEETLHQEQIDPTYVDQARVDQSQVSEYANKNVGNTETTSSTGGRPSLLERLTKLNAGQNSTENAAIPSQDLLVTNENLQNTHIQDNSLNPYDQYGQSVPHAQDETIEQVANQSGNATSNEERIQPAQDDYQAAYSQPYTFEEDLSTFSQKDQPQAQYEEQVPLNRPAQTPLISNLFDSLKNQSAQSKPIAPLNETQFAETSQQFAQEFPQKQTVPSPNNEESDSSNPQTTVITEILKRMRQGRNG
jgi:Flp pilus assembly CpaF family ATPase